MSHFVKFYFFEEFYTAEYIKPLLRVLSLFKVSQERTFVVLQDVCRVIILEFPFSFIVMMWSWNVDVTCSNKGNCTFYHQNILPNSIGLFYLNLEGMANHFYISTNINCVAEHIDQMYYVLYIVRESFPQGESTIYITEKLSKERLFILLSVKLKNFNFQFQNLYLLVLRF